MFYFLLMLKQIQVSHSIFFHLQVEKATNVNFMFSGTVETEQISKCIDAASC